MSHFLAAKRRSVTAKEVLLMERARMAKNSPIVRYLSARVREVGDIVVRCCPRPWEAATVMREVYVMRRNCDINY